MKLWRHSKDNNGKDWKTHRDELKRGFLLIVKKHADEIHPDAKHQRRLKMMLDEWDAVENEIELLRLIGRIGKHGFRCKDQELFRDIKKLLEII